MAKSRRQESKRWFEREGEGFVQRSQSRKARLEAACSKPKHRKRRQEEEIFLCEERWADENVS
jgi:hypothetical protein